LEIFDDFQTMPLADYFKVGGERSGDNLRGRSKDAPAMWAAQRKYEEKHEVHGVCDACLKAQERKPEQYATPEQNPP
jgi:hypothetical protein